MSGEKYAVRNQYGYTEYHTEDEINNLREMGETVDVIDPRYEGSTMYDRRARTDHEPTGARGEANLRGGTGHGSQWYDDGYRLSRDTDGQGDSAVHWTNQRLRKKHDDRHTPPSDAR